MNDAVHVMPKHDLIRHLAILECACGPTPQPVDRPDGSTGWVYLHHSLDGRERKEREGVGERHRWVAIPGMVAVAVLGFVTSVAFIRDWTWFGVLLVAYILAIAVVTDYIRRVTR